jgi:hypothetical protein
MYQDYEKRSSARCARAESTLTRQGHLHRQRAQVHPRDVLRLRVEAGALTVVQSESAEMTVDLPCRWGSLWLLSVRSASFDGRLECLHCVLEFLCAFKRSFDGAGALAPDPLLDDTFCRLRLSRSLGAFTHANCIPHKRLRDSA